VAILTAALTAIDERGATIMAKANGNRGPYFEIRGYVADGAHALCATAKSEVEAGRLIGQLLEDQEILFLEVLRFNTPETTEADIRNAIGRWPGATTSDDDRAALVPHERTIH
jgi:hypothetical protein